MKVKIFSFNRDALDRIFGILGGKGMLFFQDDEAEIEMEYRRIALFFFMLL